MTRYVNNMHEQNWYIPADVCVNDDGSIPVADMENVYVMHNRRDRWIMNFTGMGMPPIYYIKQRGPQQHGETILDFRLQARNIQYVLRSNESCDRNEYWAARGLLINALRPNRGAVDNFGLGRLRKILPDGTIYDIDATINQGPGFSARSPDKWDEWSFTEVLRFDCPDPTWYSPVLNTITWDIEVYNGLIFNDVGYADHLVFPDNAVFGTDVLSGNISVTYTGTWFAYPVFEITGPITNPIITNTSLDTKIALNYAISTGETVTILTQYGNKRIYSNLNDNLIGKKTEDSDLNMYIAPASTVAGGVNNFTVTGVNSEAGVTQVSMGYYTRFIGI